MKKHLYVVLLFICATYLNCQTYSLTLINLTPTGSITCNNPSVNIIVSSNYNSSLTYTWSGPSVISGSNVLIGVAGNYTVSATANTLVLTRTLSVGVYTTVIQSTVSPSSQNISCNATTTPFVMVASPTPTISGQLPFSVTHSVIAPVGSPFSTTMSASLYNAVGPGTYTYIVINNNNGCSVTSQFSVTAVSGFPTFSLTSPQNFSLGCSTKSVASINIQNASTSPLAGGPVSYSILSPGSPSVIFPGPIPPPTFTYNTPGTYTAVVRDNTTSCETRIPFTITQNTLSPPVSVVVPTRTLSCYMPTVCLQAYTPVQPAIFSWTTLSMPSPLMGYSIAVNISTASPTSSFIAGYALQVIDNTNLCVTNTVIQIYQNIYPPKALVGVSGPSAITCASPSVVLTNQSISGIPQNSPFSTTAAVISDLWEGPSPQLPLSNTNTFVAFVPGIFTLTAIDLNNGCKSSTVHVVTDNRDYPVLQGAPPGVFCTNGGTVLIYPGAIFGAANMNYLWSAPGSVTVANTTGSLNVTAPGDYSVAVTNSVNGCTTVFQLTVAICAGVSERKDEMRVNVYPNPNNGTFVIDLENSFDDCEIAISDVHGHLIVRSKVHTEQTEIDLSNQAAGVYILQIKRKEQILKIYKILRE